MRKFLIKMLVLVFIFANIFTTLSIVEYSAFPQLYSEAIFLMDGITGDVLYEQNADILYEPASTTKVMTAILAIENCNLDEPITIGKNPPLVDGSRIGIAEGEVYTMKELLLGLLLESGNDCAEAIAEHISGSNSAFGKLMTEKAHEIGATSTTF
ncbi:MAG: D-alanyl-D-alanine carboxypeptidase, partial [Clostridium celatum]|nr:D-alanyl-D-alanine carboxypeptidase [Clostridium celatum]